MRLPPWTLESLAHEWGDAYLFSYCRDRWVALRRDTRYFIAADTLDELEAAIQADYRQLPVPRAFDPPGADAYLDGPEEAGEQDSDEAFGPGTHLILLKLRQLFPYWCITYSSELETWIATSEQGSFCEHSIALVWVALARMERRQEGRIDRD